MRGVLILIWAMSSTVLISAQTLPIVYTNLEDAVQANLSGEVVEILELHREKLSELPEILRDFKQLKVLKLEKNKLTSLPLWVSELQSLEVLSVEKNRLESFPECLLLLPNLKELLLGDNLIDAIPLNIDTLQELEHLGLWGNVIRQFPASLSDMPNLKTLDLLYNDMNYDEQSWLKELLPEVLIELSDPCTCTFDE